tara:strand:+ start:153 stop:368 length:216 start_codon:yes stop_codon:yes gene_type:complete
MFDGIGYIGIGFFIGMGMNIVVTVIILRFIIIKLVLNNDADNFKENDLFWYPLLIIISFIFYGIMSNFLYA